MNKQTEQQVAAKPQHNRVAKILSIVLVALMSIIAIVTITFAVVKKDYNINLTEPAAIKFHTSNQAYDQSKHTKGDAIYNNIIKLYNQSFQITMLDALFKGKLGQNVTIEEGYQYFSSLTGTFIEFIYNAEDVQTIKLNGSKYTPTNSGINTQFVSVMIQVNADNEFGEINAYVRNGGTNTNYAYSRIRFKTYANQSALYEYINNL